MFSRRFISMVISQRIEKKDTVRIFSDAHGVLVNGQKKYKKDEILLDKSSVMLYYIRVVRRNSYMLL